MLGILQQLGVDQTFFFQFALFAVLCVFLSQVYFKPFLGLFERRHKRTVEDREAAMDLMRTAEKKFQDYQRELHEARLKARKDYEAIIQAAKQQEAEILSGAREQAKKITQVAGAELFRQREEILKSMAPEIEALAQTASEKLLRGVK